MKKIYMAGPLFSEADVNQRLLEYDVLLEAMDKAEINHEIFSPIHAPQNDKSQLPTSLDIFDGDERELMESGVVFANLDGEDAGVMMELGMVIHSDIEIYPYLTDIRLGTAGEYDKENVPWGYNQFVIGALERYKHKVYYTFEEAVQAYIENNK